MDDRGRGSGGAGDADEGSAPSMKAKENTSAEKGTFDTCRG
jgi:hypothetical protein